VNNLFKQKAGPSLTQYRRNVDLAALTLLRPAHVENNALLADMKDDASGLTIRWSARLNDTAVRRLASCDVKYKDRCDNKTYYTDFRKVLERKDIHVVAIAIGTRSRRELAMPLEDASRVLLYASALHRFSTLVTAQQVRDLLATDVLSLAARNSWCN